MEIFQNLGIGILELFASWNTIPLTIIFCVFNLILKDYHLGTGHSGIQMIIISQEGIKRSGRASVLNGVALT